MYWSSVLLNKCSTLSLAECNNLAIVKDRFDVEIVTLVLIDIFLSQEDLARYRVIVSKDPAII